MEPYIAIWNRSGNCIVDEEWKFRYNGYYCYFVLIITYVTLKGKLVSVEARYVDHNLQPCKYNFLVNSC